MSDIKNITQLRDFALDALTKLKNREIEVAEAGVTGKLCETVISTIKSQLEYAKMLQEEPQIPFMQTDDGKMIEGEVMGRNRFLTDKSR